MNDRPTTDWWAGCSVDHQQQNPEDDEEEEEVDIVFNVQWWLALVYVLGIVCFCWRVLRDVHAPFTHVGESRSLGRSVPSPDVVTTIFLFTSSLFSAFYKPPSPNNATS